MAESKDLKPECGAASKTDTTDATIAHNTTVGEIRQQMRKAHFSS